MTFTDKNKVAQNPSTPVEVLRKLAPNYHWQVRMYVAKNPSTPEDVLRNLAKDEDWGVRGNVAQNPKVSSKLLVMQFEYEKSLREPRKYILRALYAHKNLPLFAKRVIETLFGDWVL